MYIDMAAMKRIKRATISPLEEPPEPYGGPSSSSSCSSLFRSSSSKERHASKYSKSKSMMRPRHRPPAGLVVLVVSLLLLTVEPSSASSQNNNKNWFQSIVQRRLIKRDDGDGSTTSRPRLTMFPPSLGAARKQPRSAENAKEKKEEEQFDPNYFDDKFANFAAGESSSSSSSEPMTSTSGSPGSSSWSSFLSAVVPTAVVQHQQHSTATDPARLGRIAATCCRFGLAAYLGHAIYKAAAEIVQEIGSSLGSIGDDTNTAPAYSAREVQRLMEFCLQQSNSESTTTASSTRLAAFTVDPSLLRLARKLILAGLPLVRSNSADDDHPAADEDENKNKNKNPLPSVESLLLELTRTEIQLLDQCLWTAPASSSSSSSHAFLHNNGVPFSSSSSRTPYWNHIAGLRDVKQSLMRTLKLLLQQTTHPDRGAAMQRRRSFAPLFASGDQASLVHNNGGDGNNQNGGGNLFSGVLLYGPPGCGKTLLVKALATTAQLPCLVVTPSVLLRKYVGETNLQVRALFSLAAKLSPCIVCVDELDGLFRERSDSEHEVSRELKTEFVQWWDGMHATTAGGGDRRRHPILFVGATNRPFDVDASVLRRLPQSHFVGLPDAGARFELLQKLLERVPTVDDLDWMEMMVRTEGYSPSDLRHVLQTAALAGPMQREDSGGGASSLLSTEDILQALEVRPPTPLSPLYRQQLSNFANHSPSSFNGEQNNNNYPPHGFSPFHDGRAPVKMDGTETTTESGASKWETSQGNFYNVGTLEIDSGTFDTLTDLADMAKEFESTDDDDDVDDDDL